MIDWRAQGVRSVRRLNISVWYRHTGSKCLNALSAVVAHAEAPACAVDDNPLLMTTRFHPKITGRLLLARRCPRRRIRRLLRRSRRGRPGGAWLPPSSSVPSHRTHLPHSAFIAPGLTFTPSPPAAVEQAGGFGGFAAAPAAAPAAAHDDGFGDFASAGPAAAPAPAPARATDPFALMDSLARCGLPPISLCPAAALDCRLEVPLRQRRG